MCAPCPAPVTGTPTLPRVLGAQPGPTGHLKRQRGRGGRAEHMGTLKQPRLVPMVPGVPFPRRSRLRAGAERGHHRYRQRKPQRPPPGAAARGLAPLWGYAGPRPGCCGMGKWRPICSLPGGSMGPRGGWRPKPPHRSPGATPSLVRATAPCPSPNRGAAPLR